MNNNLDHLSLRNERRFLFAAAICACLTVITTIAIHRIHIPIGTFEENIQLYKNKAYLALNWMILLHCLLVMISMLGVGLIIAKYSRALAILGFILFCLFVFSEWQRTLGTLWHMNGLRLRYSSTTDPDTLKFLRLEMQHRSFQSNIYFLLFTIGFTLGNLLYGLALSVRNGLDRWLGIGLLLWACCTSLAFISDFFPSPLMDSIVDLCNKYYQPVIRLFIGIWLFRKISRYAGSNRRPLQ